MIQGDYPASPHAIQTSGRLSSAENVEGMVSPHQIEPAAQTPAEAPLPSASCPLPTSVAPPHAGRAYLWLKRCLDVVLAGCFLILILPLLAVIAIAVFIDNPGPILFSQLRVGRDNRLFRFYKFRSMVKNAPALQAQLKMENEAEGPIFKMRRDPRVTRVGRILRKYSLDELPQLYNVLRGDMSLVGPRPHLPAEVAQYEAHQRLRLTVQPGLVCLREIYGRSELTFERWIELDLQYIASRSLWTDLGILLRLVPAVLCGRGAY